MTVKISRISVPVAAITLALIVSGCAAPPNESGGNGVTADISAPNSPSPAVSVDQEPNLIQENLPDVVPEESVPEVVGNVTTKVGKEKSQEAFRWASSVARASMYIPSLWLTWRTDPLPYSAELYDFNSFMALKPGTDWLDKTMTSEDIKKHLGYITELVLIPEKLPDGATWFEPAVRNWEFELVDASAADSDEEGFRPITMTVKAKGTAGYAYQGKFYQFSISRVHKFVISQSVDPTKKWELLSWVVEPAQMSPLVESTEQPADVFVPNKPNFTVGEGTPAPDPNSPGGARPAETFAR
jgi:hypothetical protein